MYERVSYIQAAVRCSSYSKAAEDLFVSSQAIAKAIAEEEKRLGRKLFRRKGRGVQPTLFGLYYAKHATSLLEAHRAFNDALTFFNEEEVSADAFRLCIGQTPLRGNFAFWFDAEAFRALNPEINMVVSYSAIGGCASMLAYQVADAVIVPGIPKLPNAEILKVVEVPLTALVARRGKFGERGLITLDDLARTPIAIPHADETFRLELRKALFEERLENPHFVSIPLSIQGVVDFVAEGGIVFTGPQNELASLDARVAEVPLLVGCPIRYPVSFAMGTHLSDDLRTSLERYLEQCTGAAAAIDE